MSQKFVQTPAIALYTGMSAAATSAVITPYPTDIQTGRKLTMADWGTIGYFTVDPKISGYEEINSFTGLTDNGDGTGTLTGLTRNYIGEDPYTTPGTGKQHGSSAVVVFSNNPQLYASLASLANDNTYAGLNIYTQLPQSNGGNATSGNQLVTYAQVLAMATGTTLTNRLVLAGIAGETVTAGQILYLKSADNRWWKASSAVSATAENVILGIAQGAGTAGNAITNGVLIQGLDSNQTALTANTLYYLSTAGGVATSAGTFSVALGYTASTTSIFFNPNFNQQLTAAQVSALAGNNTDVAVGSGNKLITQTGLQHGAETFIADASGSSTAYTATLSPAPTSLTDGMVIRVKIGLANTTATPTLALNGLTAHTIVKGVSTALISGDIAAGQYCTFVYDLTNTQWVLQNPTNNVITKLGNKIFLQTSDFTIPADTNEDTVATFTIPAGTLGTGNAVFINIPRVILGQTTAYNITFKMKYGGTLMGTLTLSGNNTNASNGYITATLSATGATNSQKLDMTGMFNPPSGTTGIQGLVTTGTAAIDSTTDQTFLITAQNSAGNAAFKTGTIYAEKLS